MSEQNLLEERKLLVQEINTYRHQVEDLAVEKKQLEIQAKKDNEKVSELMEKIESKVFILTNMLHGIVRKQDQIISAYEYQRTTSPGRENLKNYNYLLKGPDIEDVSDTLDQFSAEFNELFTQWVDIQ